MKIYNVKAPIYNATKKVLGKALDYIQLHNEYIANSEDESTFTKLKISLPMCIRLVPVPFPRDKAGNITAFVHESLLGIPELQEGSTINRSSFIFQTLGGESIQFDPADYGISDEDVDKGIYPMFVNEAAYYEKDVAFFLTKREWKTVEFLAKDERSKI